MVDIVFMLVAAGADDGELGKRIVGCENARFAGDVAGGFEHKEFAVARAPDAKIEPLIVVLIHEHVGGELGVTRMTPDLELALLLFIFHGVKESGVVRCPCNGTDALDAAWEGLASREVFDVEHVLAEARGVSGIGQPAAIVGDVGCADLEKRIAFGKVVAVEEDFGKLRAGSGAPGALATRTAAFRQWMAYCWPSSVRV
jgi:hypothetical protein